MRKEFPLNKWLRKYVTPGRFTIGIVAYLMIMLLGPLWIPAAMIVNMATYSMIILLVIAVPSMFWWLTWEFKNPYQPEFCKECGRAKPEKFED